MTTDPDARRSRWPVVAGGTVTLCAAIVTAHGLYEVAVASGVPSVMGWLYPPITDGLALTAYVATVRLANRAGRRYAWLVVVLAAGLSGLAQAVYLAGGVEVVPAALRFGVGYWPAAAAAIAAHLLYLLGHAERMSETTKHADTVPDTIIAAKVEPPVTRPQPRPQPRPRSRPAAATVPVPDIGPGSQSAQMRAWFRAELAAGNDDVTGADGDRHFDLPTGSRCGARELRAVRREMATSITAAS